MAHIWLNFKYNQFNMCCILNMCIVTYCIKINQFYNIFWINISDILLCYYLQYSASTSSGPICTNIWKRQTYERTKKQINLCWKMPNLYSSVKIWVFEILYNLNILLSHLWQSMKFNITSTEIKRWKRQRDKLNPFSPTKSS